MHLEKDMKIVHSANRSFVDIQTAHGVTIMSTTQLYPKTYYVRDWLGELVQLLSKRMLFHD